ncbi:MAG TPA: T9SS type A sorting domain-containing protein, partial [Flavobacteriales bacterium]|nr:T9SS type A sorting domain-containing protein [Flavobacteriales bacterium]
FVEKFVPDPLNAPNVSYIDTNNVGNINGFSGNLNLYRPNGQNHNTQFCVNTGGALADTTWLEDGDVPMVAFHTVFDPFAPFTYGTVIVPTTGEQVVDVPGSNYFIPLVNQYGNNASFATLPSVDPFTIRARALYGTTQVHGTASVDITNNGEGLFPMMRPMWPAPAMEEASPWQWWDSNSALAQTIVAPPNITADIASRASNPDMSATKGRTYIDTIQGYANPRIVCALQLGQCSLVGIDEVNTAETVDVYPNPATDIVNILSGQGIVKRYRVLDMNGRVVLANTVNTQRFTIERSGLDAGTYFVELDMAFGKVVRKLMLD